MQKIKEFVTNKFMIEHKDICVFAFVRRLIIFYFNQLTKRDYKLS